MMRFPWVGLALAALVCSGVAAGADPKAVGHWRGVLKPAPTVELTLCIDCVERDGKLSATFDSPDQGAYGLPVDAIELKDATLTFGAKSIGAQYTGKLDPASTRIVGTFTQRGRATPLTLARAEKSAAPDVPSALFGTWEGKLQAGPGANIRLVLKAEKTPNGGFTLAFSSPDQSPAPLPIDALTVDGDKVVASSKAIASEFRGTLDVAKGELVGVWKQGGASLPLALKKTDKVSEPKRPQTPRPPFAYRSEDVAYPNPAAGIKLAGTLTMPRGDGPFPAVVMITGSGTQDRDETLLGHKPFLVIADALTRRGIAVLRVDDRGVGGSTGDPLTSTSEDFATDVRSGIAYLKTREEIDARRIGLIGHSEGGIIAPMVAAKSDDAAFIVLLAGTGMNGADILRAQTRLIFKAAGATDAVVDRQLKLFEAILAVVARRNPGAKPEPLDSARLEALAKAAIALIPEAERKALGDLSSKSIEAQLARVDSPWFRFFLAYDPRTALAKVRCPVLAINGTKDLQVPCDDNLKAIAGALKAGGNDRVTIRAFDGLNHLFQPCKTGAPSEYSSIETTVDPAVLTFLGDWITSTTAPK